MVTQKRIIKMEKTYVWNGVPVLGAVHATDKKLRIHFIFLSWRRLVFTQKFYMCPIFIRNILWFSKFLLENYFVFKRAQIKRIKFSVLWRLISKKNCLKFQLLDILNWICKEKFVTSWWKFENELWSYISFNGERSENDQKIFYFVIFARKNSIFHEKFNHISHFSVRWLFHEILKL